MHVGERIQGEKSRRIIEQLRKDRTVVKLRLSGHDYERLTIVIGLHDGMQHFQIDYPEGFKEAIEESRNWSMVFEFTSTKGIHYRFKTSQGKMEGKDVRIPFPDFIERLQRRKEFRLEVPSGTLMHIRINGKKYETSVINISLVGALLSLEKGFKNEPPIAKGKLLRGLTVVFPPGRERLRVRIREALVRRIERDVHTRRYHCALQFIAIEEQERSSLNALIYRFQRELLRKLRNMDS